MKEERLKEIFYEILRKMYNETKPVLEEDPKEYFKEEKNNDFMKFYLNSDRQEEIMKEIFEKYEEELNDEDKRKIAMNVRLGPSPNTSKKTWEKRKNDYNE